MKVYKGLDELKQISNPVVSIGTFDGVHIGHKIILDRLNHEASKLHGESLLITLWPHPRMVIQPDNNDLRLLNTMSEKQELLANAGLQNLLILPFSVEFSRTTPQEFVRDILIDCIGMKKIIIGYDHHFGRNREGSLQVLQEFSPILDFEVEEISAQQVDDINVSSTKVRSAIEQGDVALANEYLGYRYFINGKVINGHKIGTTIGFPTANIAVNESFKLIPKPGVYAVVATVNNKPFNGMMNIGNRPTFNGENESIEVHLFDFNMNIYDSNIKVEFCKRIRDEINFSSTEELVLQLKNDELRVRGLLSQ